MKTTGQRIDGRTHNQMRDIKVTYDVFEYAAGSVLFELGKTKILCAVSLQMGVPSFLKGKRVGWLTAEYAMLPAATSTRSARESELGRKNGRSVEISRLIGRALRAVVDCSKIGERTIIIDCDVLQADGSTRTACITAASLALEMAQERWLEARIVSEPVMRDAVAAVSVGLKNGFVLVDLNFDEDSAIDADFNVVLTRSGRFVEIQGAAERFTYTLEQLSDVQLAAYDAIKHLFNAVLYGENTAQLHERKDELVHNHAAESQPSSTSTQSTMIRNEKAPMFSLKNRLSSAV